jgi:hypothetical protein
MLVGFGRVCAPPFATRTRLFGLLNTPNGALRASFAYHRFAASYIPQK